MYLHLFVLVKPGGRMQTMFALYQPFSVISVMHLLGREKQFSFIEDFH